MPYEHLNDILLLPFLALAFWNSALRSIFLKDVEDSFNLGTLR